MKFTEAQLEAAIIELLEASGSHMPSCQRAFTANLPVARRSDGRLTGALCLIFAEDLHSALL